ncbi:MAG: hypothetical protein KC484_04240 [Colwelliaceae bacterium]|nr:hypothetical protein [Colwelliaceae bacterium]
MQANEQVNPERSQTPITLFGLSSSPIFNTILLKQTSAEAESLAIILTHLSTLEVNLKEGNFSHVISYMENNPKTCIRNIIKTPEREQYLYFSKPQLILLGKRMFFSHKFADFFKISKPEVLSFSELSELKPDFILGIEEGRSYGIDLDAMIAQLPDKNKYLKSKDDEEGLLFSMLYRQRIDVLLASPSSMKFFGRKFQIDQSFESSAIAELSPILKSHIVCSKTPEGKAIIKQFDLAIEEAYQDPTYFQTLINWVAYENHDIYRKYYNKYLKIN